MTASPSTFGTFAAHIAVNVPRVERRGRKGALVALVALIAAVLAAFAPTAHAHPLGNFSVNHQTTVRISDDEVRLSYLLDQAEIPTVQERGSSRTELLARKRDELKRGLELTVDGRPMPLRFEGAGRVRFPPGSGGLETSRFEFELSAEVTSPRTIRLHDGTFPGTVGRKAIVAAPGERTAVRTRAASTNRRDAVFSVAPGDGTVVAPRSEDGELTTTGDRSDGFAGLFERAAAGEGVLLVLLLAAFGWGALHALSPGHGKAMVAAYLVGTRGRARHAVALGATVTVTHTIGVFALGLVTLALSQYVLPEDLYPWLNLVSGLLVVAIGVGVLRARVRHAHEHSHHDHHDHHHHDVTKRGLIGMGAAAGLIPCPSALVVLLAAVAQHEIALGLLLIVAFSGGLAATLTALGLAVVYARCLVPAGWRSRGVLDALPVISALAIVGVGLLLTANAMPSLEFLFGPVEHVDEWLTGLFDGAPLVVALAIAFVLGLRHASDPDHLVAVTSLVAAEGGDTRRAAGLGAWWGLGHAGALLAIGIPLIAFKTSLPASLESGAEKAIGLVILVLALRVIYKWVRGDFRASAHQHTGGHERSRHLRRAGAEHGHVRTPAQALAIGTLHGLAGTGAVVLLLIAALPSQLEAALALAVFAPMSIVSMAACTAAFAWVLTRPIIEPVYRSVLIPGLGLFGVMFGLWYTGLG